MFFLSLASSQPNSSSNRTPAQPAQKAAAPVQAGSATLATTSTPSSVNPQGQLPPPTHAHMPIQSPTSLQVKGPEGTTQLQQSPQLISVSGLQQQVQVRVYQTHSERPSHCPVYSVSLFTGTGPAAGPAECRLSATAHQTATSYSDSAECLLLNSNGTGTGSV